MKSNLKIIDANLQSVTQELHKLLADEVVLFLKNKNYYWNIEAENFFEMRQFYKLQSDQLERVIEMTANHIRLIGSQTQTTLSDYLTATNLLEHPYAGFTRDQLKYLLASHETIINNLRRLATVFSTNNDNIGTASFASGIILEHEKMAYMVRSFLVRLPKKNKTGVHL